jgi:hypothetical protein
VKWPDSHGIGSTSSFLQRKSEKRGVNVHLFKNRAVALFEQVKPSGNGIAMAALLFLLPFFSFGFSGFFMEMRRKILVF